jgi:molybdopterin synthase catalytic subunit
VDAAERFIVTAEPIELAPLVAAVSGPAYGAVVAFLGVVRESSGAQCVRGLEYEAYPEMAAARMAAIAAGLESELGPLAMAAAHRTGRLPVGALSFALAVAAPHRAQAFAAAARFVDRLKESVPIWKTDLIVEGEG